MRFVSLHSHCTFSTGDGFGTPLEHVARVKELGMTALAMTDHGVVSAWPQLEQAAKEHEIKPIFGCEIYTATPSARKCHMTVLAMDQQGLMNLNRIVTQSWKQFKRFPTVYWADLVKYNEGLIVLSGCADSYLSCLLFGGKSFGEQRLELSVGEFNAGIGFVERCQKIFGDRFYLETQRFPDLERTCALNKTLQQISQSTGAKLVATADVHYPYPNDNTMQRILHASHRGASVEVADEAWNYDVLLTYPESDKEIRVDLMNTGLSPAMAEQAITSTEVIARRCNVTLPKAAPVRYIQ